MGWNAHRMLSEEEQQQINLDAIDYYKEVDWVLDISQAEFQEFDISSSIPAKKVKRNPELQAIAYRENIDIAKIKGLKGIEGVHQIAFDVSQNKDTIIVVPTLKNKHLKSELESLRILREEGIVALN